MKIRKAAGPSPTLKLPKIEPAGAAAIREPHPAGEQRALAAARANARDSAARPDGESQAAWAGSPRVRRAPAAPHVDRGEQEQPDDVDEVPVPGGRFEAEMLPGREVAAVGADQADDQEDRADDARGSRGSRSP